MKKNEQIIIKVTKDEKQEIFDKAEIARFSSVSEYIRFLVLNSDVKVNVGNKKSEERS